MKTTLLLIRHGESEGNLRRVFCGNTDIPLTERGRQQAACTGEFLKDRTIHAVYSSPLSRAYDTALAVAAHHGLPVTPEPDLAEICGGRWEGLSFTEIAERYPESYAVWQTNIGRCQCPEGESVLSVQTRLYACAQRLAAAHPGQTVCLATHAMAIRCLVGAVEHRTLDELHSMPWVSNASVTTLSWEDGIFTLERYSEDDHMTGLVTRFNG